MELRTKDYVYVGLQVIIFVLYAVDSSFWYFQVSGLLKLFLLILSLTGLAILIIAMVQLKRSLSPFPTPRSNAGLVQSGLYKFVRHPIYSGILLCLGAYAIYSGSGLRILLTLVLYILLLKKSSYEEQQLIKHYKNYEAYKKRTGRFFPKL